MTLEELQEEIQPADQDVVRLVERTMDEGWETAVQPG